MKKLIIILSVVVLSLGICLFLIIKLLASDSANLNKTSLKNAEKYSKWFDELDIAHSSFNFFYSTKEKIKLTNCVEENDVFIINIDVSLHKTDLLEKMLDKDNDFIKSNPDYFENHKKRVLYRKANSSVKESSFILSNSFYIKTEKNEGIENLNLDIPYTKDDLFRITYIPCKCFDKVVNKRNTEIFILDVSDLYCCKDSYKDDELVDYKRDRQSDVNIKLLKEYSSLKYVVLKTHDKQDNYTLLMENIKKEYPDVKVYIIYDDLSEKESE